ncbi:PREDICTED: tyrosine aminotransferase [Nicrophorus vespilloides]|uniref:Tyrosine aminotransferase n=1 Tax=Nicrophorus vespilloides TaxID=110193 RepID=A0ABM1M014_NICVS|nr:PREDICTED: tyrosine aminotransferase [Nicrophorus vespilloides]
MQPLRTIKMNVTARTEWAVEASKIAQNSEIPLMETIRTWKANPNKAIISFTSEDPTDQYNFKTSKETLNAIFHTIQTGKNNGYAPSVGYENSRNAVAEYMSKKGVELTAKDIILCSGCSSALDLCLTVMVDGRRNQNVLIPKPGFYLYKMLAKSLGISVKEYDLLPNDDWQINLYDLDRKIDSNTAAVLISNPSNPCGSVYSTKHLLDIVEICDRHKIPIIADESYDQLVFNANFVSLGALETTVPILICGGLSKGFLVPGWRLGWILIVDPIDAFQTIRKGLVSLTQRIIGCNTVIQGALPTILNANSDFIDDVNENLKKNATVAFEAFQIDGLKPYMPQGALHMIIGIDLNKFRFNTSMEFLQKFYEEESVHCLPSEVFGVSGFMRIILVNTTDEIIEASERLTNFCKKYIL